MSRCNDTITRSCYARIKLELGLRIKALRVRRGIGVEKYSKVFSTKKERLDRIERGKIFSSLNLICKIIKKENINPCFLFSFINDIDEIINEKPDLYEIIYYELTDYDILKIFNKTNTTTKLTAIQMLKEIKQELQTKNNQGMIKG